MSNSACQPECQIMITELNCTSFYDECILPKCITKEQFEFHSNYVWWMDGVGSLMISSIGILFNLTTIVVVLGTELAANFFNWLLVFLAIFDNFFLLNRIFESFRNHFISTEFHNYVFVSFLYYFQAVTMCCSEYMKILLAFERYNALATPLEFQRTNAWHNVTLREYFSLHKVRLMKYFIPVIVFISIFYIPKTMELQLEMNQSNQSVIYGTDLRSNDAYISWYLNFANILVTVVVPLTTVVYLNINIALLLKRHVDTRPQSRVGSTTARQETQSTTAPNEVTRRERNMVQQTLMLFAIVILYLICHTPRTILNIEEFVTLNDVKMAKECNCAWLHYWTIIVVPISHILLQVNSGTNLFIYCLFNSLFRKALRHKFGNVLILIQSGCGFRQPNNNLQVQTNLQLVTREHIKGMSSTVEQSINNGELLE